MSVENKHPLKSKGGSLRGRELGVIEADKGQFDEILRRMVKRNPQKTSDIHHRAKIRPATEEDEREVRRKNPYEGPLPEGYKFDGQPLTPEQIADVERQKKLFAEYDKKHKKKR
jgi:hypothetical protein